MSWDAHAVLAVPGISMALPGRDAVACIAAFLPLSQKSAASLFPLTMQGRSPWSRVPAGCWEGWDRNWGPSSTCCPKPGVGNEEEPGCEHWEMGLGGQSSRLILIPISRGKEDAVWK